MQEPLIQLGIIGFGRIVELIHLPVLKRLSGIEVGGVFDITPQRLQLASKRGLNTYSDLDDLLASPVDAVLIATPHHSHFALAVQAIKSGKHVIVEKPVTLTYSEAVQLKELAEDHKRSITVLHNRRFDRDYQLVKQVIADGELGPLLFINRRHHAYGSGASFGVKSFHPDWRNEAYYGGGALLDWGVHLIDQLLHLDIGRFRGITAVLQSMRWNQGDAEDYVQAFIQTEQDILVSFEINFASHVSSPSWVVGGEYGTLEVVSDKEALIHSKGKETRIIELKPSLYEGTQQIYTSFYKHLTEGEPLTVTIDEAIETMRVIDDLRRSAKLRKEVQHGDPVLSSSSGI